MGGKTSTSSSSGGGGGSSNNNNNNNQANQIAKQVKKNIGLVEKKAGPFDYLQKGATTGYYASAYAGTSEADFYGGKASTAAKKRMAEAGMGTYNPENDSFQNVVRDPKTGKMTIVSGTQDIMGGSMGSGENTVMGQVPISKAMFESQKRLQMIATGAMTALGVPLMGAAFMDYKKKRYSDYVTSFSNSLSDTRTSTSYASTVDRDTSDATIQDTKAQAEASEAEGVQQANLRKAALARKEAAVKGTRRFFDGKKRIIEGRMIGGL
jgi:hypothetical protein